MGSAHESKNMNYACSHYGRLCKIRAPCCGEIYDCSHCHNEAKNSLETNPFDRHDIPLHEVEKVICSICEKEQDVQQKCIDCGVCMGIYFCAKCKLFDDDISKNHYHCDECGICRTGGKENFFHCKSCGCCYAKFMKDAHRCVERARHDNCPICFEFLFHTMEDDIIVLSCGHTIHVGCLQEMEKHYLYSCPICRLKIDQENTLPAEGDSDGRILKGTTAATRKRMAATMTTTAAKRSATTAPPLRSRSNSAHGGTCTTTAMIEKREKGERGEEIEKEKREKGVLISCNPEERRCSAMSHEQAGFDFEGWATLHRQADFDFEGWTMTTTMKEEREKGERGEEIEKEKRGEEREKEKREKGVLISCSPEGRRRSATLHGQAGFDLEGWTTLHGQVGFDSDWWTTSHEQVDFDFEGWREKRRERERKRR